MNLIYLSENLFTKMKQFKKNKVNFDYFYSKLFEKIVLHAPDYCVSLFKCPITIKGNMFFVIMPLNNVFQHF